VNGLDISVIAGHWLSSGAFTIGDANHDGFVNGLDISAIAGHWLQSGGAGGGASSPTAVPEPATYVLCVIGVGLALAWRKVLSCRTRNRCRS